MEIDPSLAKKLFSECAVLVIAGVPVGTHFGIDLCSHVIAENFRGIKMIPPGPHFVWCASKGRYGDVAPRVGFIHFFKGNEIIVRQWNRTNEELCERQTVDPELEKRNIRENLEKLDKFLAPYNYGNFSEWKQLTDTITEQTVLRCQPALGTIRTNVELQSCPDSERPRGDKKDVLASNTNIIVDEDDLLPNLKPLEGTAPRFTILPKRVPENALPADVSKHCMDCIEAVDILVNSFPNWNELIEEIQLSFVFFLMGYSIESLSHWRKILHLLANSESAVVKLKLFYMKYSEVLAHQLPRLPEELMTPTRYNLVHKDVRSLLINLNLAGLNKSAERLANKLSKAMKWDFHGLLDDDPEELPVFVETV